MQRREFITLLGGAAVWPLAARAQQRDARDRVPLHGATTRSILGDPMAAFRKSLSEAGYSEAQNVTIEFRWAEGRLERLPELATDLVRRQVSVIFAGRRSGAPRFSQSGYIENPDCVCEWRRSGRGWTCGQPQPTGWKHNGRDLSY